MFNDGLSSEYEVKKLIQEQADKQAASETQIDLCKSAAPFWERLLDLMTQIESDYELV